MASRNRQMRNYFNVAAIVLLLFLVSCAKAPTSTRTAADERKAGFFPGTFDRLDRVILREEERNEIPAAAIVVRRAGRIVYANAFGTTLPRGRGEKVTTNSLFDLASLTKPLAGVPCGLILMEQESADQQAIQHLLRHASTLNDETDFPRLEDAKEKVVRINGDSLRYRYANANYLLLTRMAVEQLDDPVTQLETRFWRPMGIHQASWFPASQVVWGGKNIDGAVIAGRPYDGVADSLLAQGYPLVLHSGLFASAEEVALFAESALEEQGKLGDYLFGSPEEMPAADEEERRVHVSPGGLISPAEFPYASVGSAPGRFYYHSGYTGCFLWVDKRTRTSAALLTNAAATGAREQWKEFSESILEALVRGIDED